MNVRLVSVCALLAACGGTIPKATCATAGDCQPGSLCIAGACQPDPAICPSLKPTFASINTGLLQPSCFRASSKDAVGCHAGDAASGLPDFNTDPTKLPPVNDASRARPTSVMCTPLARARSSVRPTSRSLSRLWRD